MTNTKRVCTVYVYTHVYIYDICFSLRFCLHLILGLPVLLNSVEVHQYRFPHGGLMTGDVGALTAQFVSVLRGLWLRPVQDSRQGRAGF